MTAEDANIPATIVTLRIDLLDTDPPIWRELEVPTSVTLKQLHAIIQAAMGWGNAHLWEFILGREHIAESRAAKLFLHELLRPRKTKLFYLYDFGDSWEHQLTLTQPRPASADVAYPRYVAGEQAAPPEDCGGIPGFYSQLDILADPDHPDHDDVKEWLGDYDENEIAKRLTRISNRQRTTARKSQQR